MQQFTSVADMLQAFKKITLRSDLKNRSKINGDKSDVKSKDVKSSAKGESRSKDIRCYNCNQTGHILNECKRPQREKGTCYSYGEFGHRINDCPKKVIPAEKKEIGNVEIMSGDHDFRRNTYEISYPNVNNILYLSTLFDTGSPVSFIREQFVRQYDTDGTRYLQNNFYGINRSKLVIRGVIKANIVLDQHKKINVPNDCA